MKIVTVVGARPQLVKAAAVSRVVRSRVGVTEVLVHTGQHFDPEMSAVFFEELALPAPSHHLGVAGGSRSQMVGRMVQALEPVLCAERPDVVLLYGDTNSTLAGALTATALQLPVAHVEAGLRSFNRQMAEEVNRVVTDHLSSFLFAPTQAAVTNLATEGIAAGVHHVGDVMFDVALTAGELARGKTGVLEGLGVVPHRYAVATVHRAETTDDPARLEAVVSWLKEQARVHDVLLPLHPRTRAALERDNLDVHPLKVCKPLGYLDMTKVVMNAAVVYTDSGGLQKEAYFHRVPCVTLRSETEWVETIESGWNRLWNEDWKTPRSEISDYGKGRAAEAIVDLLVSRGWAL